MDTYIYYVLCALLVTMVGMALFKMFARVGVKIWDIQGRKVRSFRIKMLTIVFVPLIIFVSIFIPFYLYREMDVPAGNFGEALAFLPAIALIFYLFVFLKKEGIEMEAKAKKYKKEEKEND